MISVAAELAEALASELIGKSSVNPAVPVDAASSIDACNLGDGSSVKVCVCVCVCVCVLL